MTLTNQWKKPKTTTHKPQEIGWKLKEQKNQFDEL